jgi:hypothetical protein
MKRADGDIICNIHSEMKFVRKLFKILYNHVLRYLVAEVDVTVNWSDTLLCSIICHGGKAYCYFPQHTQCRAGFSCDQTITDYKSDEYCIMLLTLAAYYIQARE